MLYLISYDLKTPGRDYAALYQAIKNYGTWWHYLASVWIVKTKNTATEISSALRKKMDANDYLLVIKIDGQERDGWLPEKAWEWLRKHDAQTELPF